VIQIISEDQYAGTRRAVDGFSEQCRAREIEQSAPIGSQATPASRVPGAMARHSLVSPPYSPDEMGAAMALARAARGILCPPCAPDSHSACIPVALMIAP
jgi:hypothetical protein